MANKDIRAIYDNGTMIWPATTTTAVVDPTSREALDVILEKKEDKPIEITECIPSRLMSINSAEDAVTLSSAEETQLAPLVTGFTTTGTKFTFGTLPAVSTDYTNTYSWEIWGLPGITAKFLIWIKLHYIDKEVSGETVRSYWLEQGYENVLFSETDPTNQPTFIDVDMADLVVDSVTYPGEVWYLLSEEDDPYPESTFIDSKGRNKRIVLRIRPFEDDDYNWGIEFENPESWYFPIAIELSPLEGDYYPQSGVLHAAGTAEILRGIQLYNGILYCALIYTFEEDNNHNYYIAIHKTEMKGKISGMPAYEDTPTYPTEGDTYTTGFGKLNRIIQSHEEVTARALLDLNTRVLALGSGGGNSGGGGMTEITYSNLVTLKNGGNLTPGQLYRITDYTCTTTQTDTQSAGHVFDIIVLALSESTLSETAWAGRHEGDTYFSNCKLEAWELKYCLDNDTTRFKWADSTNGRGVIYYMKDEWENEAPYDFKNIQFKRQLTNGSLDTTSGTNTWCYTFNYWNSTTSASEDLAMYNLTSYTQYGQTDYIAPCIRNKLGKTVTNYQTTPYTNYNIILSNIVFLCTEITGDSCRDNYFGDQCRNITIGSRCFCNTFKNNCSSIIFGDNCYYNTFSEQSYNITIGGYCREISGKEHVSDINIADNCGYISIGASCRHITLSKNYTYNLTVGDGNQYITITSSLTTTNSGAGALNKIYIAPHTNITTVTKTISHDSLGDTFLTTYKSANSVEVSV
jgi:hypothetical protein